MNSCYKCDKPIDGYDQMCEDCYDYLFVCPDCNSDHCYCNIICDGCGITFAPTLGPFCSECDIENRKEKEKEKEDREKKEKEEEEKEKKEKEDKEKEEKEVYAVEDCDDKVKIMARLTMMNKIDKKIKLKTKRMMKNKEL